MQQQVNNVVVDVQQQKNRKFAKSLTRAERKFLWAHVHMYDGVEGVSAQEQFKKLPQYVLNFFPEDGGGESAIHLRQSDEGCIRGCLIIHVVIGYSCGLELWVG